MRTKDQILLEQAYDKINEPNNIFVYTIQMDKGECLHIWEGKVIPRNIEATMYKADGKHAPVYIQDEQTVQHILQDILSPEEVDQLKQEIPITTTNLDREFFQQLKEETEKIDDGLQRRFWDEFDWEDYWKKKQQI